MKLTSSWIRSWLRRTMLSDTQIVDALERSGMEVEQVILSPEIDSKVVVALVKEVVQHPAADRLHLVFVTTGVQDFRVVCGAPNVRPGIRVAFAQIGSVLPGGERIQQAKLRGEISEGMLCSEFELGLGKDHEGILELPGDVQVGIELRALYPADTVMDIKTPANRFDVLSVVGLAREVAAMADEKLKPLDAPALEVGKARPAVKAQLEAERYMIGHFALKQPDSTPAWLVARLRSVGVRSISPVVDITNYLMLDLGQPLHAFDAKQVILPIEVRRAKVGESLTTLDGVTRKLTAQDLVIADATGPIALAGVMGGASTEVTTATTEILLEAAVFDAATVRKMAQRHGLRTEASARFERGLPVELPVLAMARAQEMLAQLAAGEMLGMTDHGTSHQVEQRIALEKPRLERLVGLKFASKQVVQFLARLEIEAAAQGDKIVVSKVPWWRPDLRLPEDLVEEVVRVLGYDHVPATLPVWRPTRVVFDRDRAKRRQVRDVLFAAGLFEVTTYAFVAEEQLRASGLIPGEHLKLKNPLSQEQAYLRSSLLPSHLAVLARNRNYSRDVGFYELSAVFLKQGQGEQPDEPLRLGMTVRRSRDGLAYVKGVFDAMVRELNADVTVKPQPVSWSVAGRSGGIYVGSQRIGWIGQVHPERVHELKIEDEVGYLELDMAPLLVRSRPKQFQGVAKFPTISRDVTVEVPLAVTWADIQAAVEPQPVTYVGEYHGSKVPEGYKAVTLRLVVARADRTPTEAEAAEAEVIVRSRLDRKLGAKTRG
jgi:phenylalanyl-tRNA synthetase beta chain